MARKAVETVASMRWRPQPSAGLAPTTLETMSVVLPCAFEGEFAEKTVRAIWDNTDHKRVKEILVVDDGSKPPLRTQFSSELLNGGSGIAPMRIIRHERTLGLISAKKSGGDAAKGDVIVFFDCHISPRRGWEDSFIKQMQRAGDHRTVVVPTITSLDPDTWKEIPNGANGKSCYVLWNTDFTWLSRPGRDVPLMSGGLLAMSRRWWQETEGYDEHMVAWGGENIDQSIRTWLCGGRIEVAAGAYVAHMWRDPKNPKTTLKYPIPTRDVMRNKARATKAWFGEFADKAFTFPEYEAFSQRGESLGDMSNFERLQKKLQCKPFTHYLQRFSYVYFDSGLIPSDVFQVRETKTGLCLERVPAEQQPHTVALKPCGGGERGGPIPEVQLWHSGNRDRSRDGGPCCSGLMNWNFLQCLDAVGIGSKVKTFECEIQGGAQNQFFALESGGDKPGQLFWRPKDQKTGACVATVQAKGGDAKVTPTHQCQSRVEAEGDQQLHMAHGQSVPANFRLRSSHQIGSTETCGLAVGADASDSVSGYQLAFQKCDPTNDGQVFHAKKMLDGLQIRVGETDNCLDSVGGTQVLVYPCYEESVQNLNQVWQIRDNRLVWEGKGGRGGICINFAELPHKGKRRPGAFTLQTCTPKPGQRLQKFSETEDGTFLFRDADTGGCLIKKGSDQLAMGDCGEDQRWREHSNTEQVQHVDSGLCIDAGANEQSPVLYPCHKPRASRKQRFKLVDEPGWIQLQGTWGDNGRKRWFDKCLDHKPEEPVDLTIQRCQVSRKTGTSWEKLHAHTPLERRLWDQAEKPPPGTPPLGGDPAPP